MSKVIYVLLGVRPHISSFTGIVNGFVKNKQLKLIALYFSSLICRFIVKVFSAKRKSKLQLLLFETITHLKPQCNYCFIGSQP